MARLVCVLLGHKWTIPLLHQRTLQLAGWRCKRCGKEITLLTLLLRERH